MAAPPPPPPPPPDTITISGEQDFRGSTLNGITSIRFEVTGDYGRGTFSSSQFGGGHISETVNITGDDKRNFIVVDLAVPGTFSAAGWTFSNWVPFDPLEQDQVSINGTTGADTLIGSSQADGLFGDDGDDILNGGEGRDILIGGAGVDSLRGGAGDDSYRLEDAHLVSSFPLRFAYDEVIEDAGGGIDTVLVRRVGIVGGYTLPANIENGFIAFGTGTFTLFGNELDNTLTGNDDANTLFGAAGTDKLLGQGGDDRLEGGDGNDVLDGGIQIDTASYASAGAAVTVSLAFDGPQDTGGAGIDTLVAIENLLGSGFNDTLTGNGGANRLDGGGGDDTLRGRNGDDTYFVDSAGDEIGEAAGGGNDAVQTTVSYALGTGPEIETLSTTDAAGTAAIDLTGNGFNNTLIGNAGANFLTGKPGDDRLIGGDGNDRLNGGAGQDALEGGTGRDTGDYSEKAGAVVVDLAGANEVIARVGGVDEDTIKDIENIIGGTGDDVLMGDGLANALRGTDGDDVLKGGAGDDTLIGGAGLDTLVGGLGLDRLSGAGDDDLFVYGTLTASGITAATRDQISNFVSGDRVDVHQIDAIEDGTDDAFVLDTNNGSFDAGEIRQTVTDGGNLRLDFNVDADATPEMSIVLIDRTTPLGTGDFVL